MAKSDLLKQAIADAKTVKETALANAKLALQEAFAPKIQRMFAEKLDAELMGEEDEEAAGMDMGAEMGGNEMEGGDDFTWTDDSLAASVGGKDYSFQVGMAGGEEMPAGEEEEAAPTEDEMQAEYNEGMDMENPEDLNLEAIIRELEEDLEDPMDAPDTADQQSQLGEEYMYDREEDDMMPRGTMEEEEDNIDAIIEAILRETEVVDDATPSDLMQTEEGEMIEAMEAEIEEKDAELKEAYRTVKRLQSVINEVNLLNAKLLYTNKLFRNFELTEAQKMKVIENFDRASNTRETKLVFTTLAESFKRPTTKKRVVKESYSAASKPVTTTAPSVATTQVLSEGFELANRWKKLAGLL